MELGLKICAAAAAASLCAVTLRRGAPELSLVIALAAGALLLFQVMDALDGVLALAGRLAALAGLEGDVLRPVIRVVGLSILTHVTGEICRASQEGGIAAFLQVAGTALALAAAAPLAAAVLEQIGGMVS